MHITHLVMLFSGHEEKAQMNKRGSAHLIEHYFTFVGQEWNSALITDIYLETGTDKLRQKSCVDPLFEKVWGGIVPYTYTREELDAKGNTYLQEYTVTLGP